MAGDDLDALLTSTSREVLREVVGSARLSEDQCLALLKRRDLPPGVIDELTKNHSAMKHRKVKMAVVCHPRTPRHISLPLVRHLFTFELMQIALMPGVPSDLKIQVEEAILNRLEQISTGERLTLARRASTRVAATLLVDPEQRVIEAALESPFITEAWVVKALMKNEVPAGLVELVCRHPKWSLRRDVRIALLRVGNIPLARAVEYAKSLPPNVLRDVLHYSRMETGIKEYLQRELEQRTTRGRRGSHKHGEGAERPGQQV